MKNIKFTGLDDAEFRSKIQKYHEEYLNRMQTWLIKPTSVKVTVHVCDRMKSNAGWAYYRNISMKLNYWLLYQNDAELQETYGHELAHLITHMLYNRKGYSPTAHGPEWKHVMKNLGLEPKRCHDFSRVQMKKMKTEYREVQNGCKNQTQQEDVVSPAAQPGRP